MEYNLPIQWTTSANVTIEADTLEEAVQMFQDNPLPYIAYEEGDELSDLECMEDSCTIDLVYTAERYPDEADTIL